MTSTDGGEEDGPKKPLEEDSKGLDETGDEEDGAIEGDELGSEEDDWQLQRKLHLFRCWSVQQSVYRFWPFLQLNANGLLSMDGYVELNLRLQKSLTEEFLMERAVDSAIGDWSEDVLEGQQAMTADDFAMFLFELSSLWCGPNTSLSVYLLFLNSVFIAITDSRGSHTVGLKPLEAIERLPSAFFDLLSLQGWGKSAPESKMQNEEQALAAWLRRNLATEKETSAVENVQRQIFQLTHDVRSVFLFRKQDGKDSRGHDVLDLVKSSTTKLSKVSPVSLPNALPPKPGQTRSSKVSSTSSQALALPSASGRVARGRSAPGRPRALPASAAMPYPASQQWPQQPESLPCGRMFETQMKTNHGRGLALAGQAAVASVPGKNGLRLPLTRDATQPSDSFAGTSDERSGSREYMPYSLATSHSLDLQGSSSIHYVPQSQSLVVRESAELLRTETEGVDHVGSIGTIPESQGADASPQEIEEGYDENYSGLQAPMPSEEDAVPFEELQGNPAQMHELNGAARHLLPNYKLPKNPPDVYSKQAAPLMSMRPSSLVFEVTKFQGNNPLLPPPFERALKKLPEHVRPQEGQHPVGPLTHPNEPVWSQMTRRLEVILRKQGRRAERRRKRRQRSKLGYPPRQKQSEGRNLREYLDRNLEQAKKDVPGEAAGEFLGKVHEKYLKHKENIETERFQVPGSSSSALRTPRVVRPIYMPPPGGGIVAH
eukprot:TRINITY_DN9739_c0_g1_i1.p1 TRINITY_DN9739_c0_g1~~TRINITY_DN9739_c0_g1_i1.p1  ORF type:complete len:715 (-),score=133.80 TRINITY_DN9739_c0_g1_i1:207-2351(-)